jgi:hypothetical protein
MPSQMGFPKAEHDIPLERLEQNSVEGEPLTLHRGSQSGHDVPPQQVQSSVNEDHVSTWPVITDAVYDARQL